MMTATFSSAEAERDLTSWLIEQLAARGQTLAVAESLTGGLLIAELIRPAGASRVITGGVVAYHSALKESILGVEQELLSQHGPVHPAVAEQMAAGVRKVCAVGEKLATIGVSTTGVAGPDSHDGHAAGTVYLGLSTDKSNSSYPLQFSGTRTEIRTQVVNEAVRLLVATL